MGLFSLTVHGTFNGGWQLIIAQPLPAVAQFFKGKSFTMDIKYI